MKRAIDSEKFYDFLTDQLVKETGAFSKGVNKGLNIARSALHNEQITPTLTPPSTQSMPQALAIAGSADAFIPPKNPGDVLENAGAAVLAGR